MTNAELLAKIKAEIVRLKTVQFKRIQEGDLVDAEPYDKIEAYNELLSFLDTLEAEKPVPNDIEEAANKFAVFYDHGTCDGIAQDCFIAGAKWQKEQMMQEAVEVEVYQVSKTESRLWYPLSVEQYKEGDKVRVIVLKKED